MFRLAWKASFCLLLAFSSADARTFSYGNQDTVLGSTEIHRLANENESLIELARDSGIGYNEIVDANPGLDPFVPGEGASVLIPTEWVLPEIPSKKGIVINLSEMRLYFFFKKNRLPRVMTFPIGIGDEGTATPVGIFHVSEKKVNPSWYVPESIRRERPELPAVVPPGPDNPLGTHALRLSLGTVLIHGTNRPFGIGRWVSHGCIRLYPEDIPRLFQAAPKGTRVYIVRQPVKIGMRKGRVYTEVHADSGYKNNYFNDTMRLLKRRNLLERIATDKLDKALKEKRGVPVEISK